MVHAGVSVPSKVACTQDTRSHRRAPRGRPVRVCSEPRGSPVPPPFPTFLLTSAHHPFPDRDCSRRCEQTVRLILSRPCCIFPGGGACRFLKDRCCSSVSAGSGPWAAGVPRRHTVWSQRPLRGAGGGPHRVTACPRPLLAPWAGPFSRGPPPPEGPLGVKRPLVWHVGPVPGGEVPVNVQTRLRTEFHRTEDSPHLLSLTLLGYQRYLSGVTVIITQIIAIIAFFVTGSAMEAGSLARGRCEALNEPREGVTRPRHAAGLFSLFRKPGDMPDRWGRRGWV